MSFSNGDRVEFTRGWSPYKKGDKVLVVDPNPPQAGMVKITGNKGDALVLKERLKKAK